MHVSSVICLVCSLLMYLTVAFFNNWSGNNQNSIFRVHLITGHDVHPIGAQLSAGGDDHTPHAIRHYYLAASWAIVIIRGYAKSSPVVYPPNRWKCEDVSV